MAWSEKVVRDELWGQLLAQLYFPGEPPTSLGAPATGRGGQQVRRNFSWARPQRPPAPNKVFQEISRQAWMSLTGMLTATRRRSHSSDIAKSTSPRSLCSE